MMCKDIREYLRSTTSALGLGSNEIFPKQDEVIAKRGDIGNWINMPYFGDKRQCIILDNKGEVVELTIYKFLDYAESRKVPADKVKQLEIKIDYDSSVIKEGPPCLQALSISKFPSGTRNISLFNLGVYAKKAFPNEWTKKVELFNQTLYKEPLLSREVGIILKSLDKKEYFYQCSQEPLCSFCNPKLCRTRKHGISATSAMPIINSVTKVAGDFSVWFIDVEGGRLELTTEELYDNRKFRMKCINSLNILPNAMKPEQWSEYLQSILDKAIVINDENMFRRHEVPDQFYAFMMQRVTENPDEINQGRVIYIKDRKEIQFKLESFLNYMKYKKITIDKGWIVMFFKMRGAKAGVGKTRDRKSYRYTALSLNDEEAVDIDSKLREGNII